MLNKLHGYVDEVSARRIAGWAVDKADLERIVNISIFFDEQKIRQVRCDQFRDDLAAGGDHGSGRHGFEALFEPPLPIIKPTRVTVRHTESGRLLTRGDQMLPSDASPSMRDFNVDLSDDDPRLPFPSSQREWFERLSLYQPEEGLYRLVAQCEITEQNWEQIAHGILGYVDDTIDHPDLWQRGEARDAAYHLLMSPQFQSGLIWSFLRSFPEKHRFFFVQIPVTSPAVV